MSEDRSLFLSWWVGSSPTPMGWCWICPCTLNRLLGEPSFSFFMWTTTTKKQFFLFCCCCCCCFFYQMRISCTSLWLVERSLVFVSETFSIRFFMENRKPENVTWPRSCGRFCSSLFTFERKQGLPAVSDLQQGFLPLNIGQPCV